MSRGFCYVISYISEQPVQLNTITHRLVKEGQQFLQQRADDQRPFLLYMSWLQAHTALHASREFKYYFVTLYYCMYIAKLSAIKLMWFFSFY